MKFIPVFFSLILIPSTISAQDAVKRDEQQMHRLTIAIQNHTSGRLRIRSVMPIRNRRKS